MSEVEWSNICSRTDTCALTGSLAFFAGIKRAEILVNGPLWCYFYAMRYLEHADGGVGERIYGSQADNRAIVYGAEDFLLAELARIGKTRQPDILFVASSCAMSLIGDDIRGIVGRAGLTFPTIAVDCGGTVGGFAEGYAKASLALLRELPLEKRSVGTNSINLLGVTEFYLNGRSDIKELVRLLEKCGYKIQTILGGGSSLAEIQEITSASLNIVIHQELGLKAAQYLEEQFGMPYICVGMPYGIDGSLQWLDKIAAALPADLKQVRQEADRMQLLLAAQSHEARAQWGELWFENVIIAAPATTAVGIAEAVRREWLDTGRLCVVCQNQRDFSLKSAMADELLFAGRDAIVIDELLHDFADGLLLASGSEWSQLRRYGRSGIVSVNIAFPVYDEVMMIEQPFCGILGSAYMQQRLWNAFIIRAIKSE